MPFITFSLATISQFALFKNFERSQNSTVFKVKDFLRDHNWLVKTVQLSSGFCLNIRRSLFFCLLISQVSHVEFQICWRWSLPLFVFLINGPKKMQGHFWHQFLIQTFILFHVVPFIFFSMAAPITAYFNYSGWLLNNFNQ